MKKTVNRVHQIILIVLLGCIVMAFTDAILKPGYMIKSGIKIFFFLFVPLFCLKNDEKLKIKQWIIPDKKGMVKSVLLGLVIYLLIIAGYLIVRNFYDFSSISSLLTEDVGVTRDNFIFVAIYISLCNSFLEEFFFRGLAFLGLAKFTSRKKAYYFSSIMFALYHIAIMNGWFSFWLFMLALSGLFIGGIIFNYLDEENGTIYPSWMVHMFANLAINTVGLILFGILG